MVSEPGGLEFELWPHISIMVSEPGGLEFELWPHIFRCA
jgi:hypothetical protein